MFEEELNEIKPRLGEIFIPLDEEERNQRQKLLENYRDRAEERRQGGIIDEK